MMGRAVVCGFEVVMMNVNVYVREQHQESSGSRELQSEQALMSCRKRGVELSVPEESGFRVVKG